MLDPVPHELPTRLFKSVGEWEAWLAANHDRSRGLRLKLSKRGAGAASVTYAQALEVAIQFGWIDGQKGALDAACWLQKFTPRGPKSRWSKVNRATAMRLTKEGRMRPAGLAAIESAKADGRWEAAYDSQSRASVPPDLRRALASNAAAQGFFETLDSHNRYAILYRIHDAKSLETRAKRIATYVQMLARGETLHPRKKKRA
ncbi:MAG TPA: YdeI/OmpD-associated family protein [Polyangiaceae bacterium]